MDTDKEAAGFERIVPRNASLDRIACELIFGEGPVWNARQSYLSWVDIVGDTIWKWTPGTRDLDLSSTFRESQRHDL